MQYDESQLAAIALCCSSERITAVSGAAGCGKTTIMRQVYDNLSAKGRTCVMCAPTGKAARRISQATGIPAVTIHRLLEFPRPGEVDKKTGKPLAPGMPTRNRKYPLDQDCVLIDEAPMASTVLMRQIYEALPPGGIIRMFGDMNQLPPVEDVGREAPFWIILNKTRIDMMGREPIRMGAVLTQNYRQIDGSGIIANGMRIIEGRYPRNEHDFKMHTSTDNIGTLKRVLENSSYDYASMANQIITPMRKGKSGTAVLNEVLRLKYNPKPSKKVVIERHEWHEAGTPYTVGVGDKVIITKNWYDLGKEGILNGESGRVVDITSSGDIVVDFETEVVAIPNEFLIETSRGTLKLNPQRDLELAYALTTHKAQGSEYDSVIYLIDQSHRPIIHRNNFYTAITRARQFVTLIYNPRSMARALAKDPLIKKKD